MLLFLIIVRIKWLNDGAGGGQEGDPAAPKSQGRAFEGAGLLSAEGPADWKELA